MKSLVLILAFSCAVVLAADDDQKCKADFQSFLVCVKEAHQKKPESEKEAAKKEHRDKANKCFVQASCDAPDWDADPTGASGGSGKPPGAGMEMPKVVKDCLKKKMIDKIGSKLNGCLESKGVKNVNFSALAESIEGTGLDVEAQQDAREGIHGSFKAKFNAVKAVDKCAQKKGGDTNSVKPLEQCLHEVKKGEKPRVCALIKPCVDKSSADCKKRGQEIYKAICQCKKQKEQDIAKKLQGLGSGQKKVAISALIKTVADDQDIKDIMTQVEACYTENKEPEPPMLKVALQVLAGAGGGPPQLQAMFSVNASTVVIMSDMMKLDADDDSECQPCP